MIELVAGGARSGKSRYALHTAEAIEGTHVFVATATNDDESMARRILAHQAERSEQWQLIESPLVLAPVVVNAGEDDVLLIDCLTLWLTNWLCKPGPDAAADAWLADWLTQKQSFLCALEQTRSNVIMVTNEVGQGVVPMGQLSRDFVDHAGWLHQEIAAIADKVTMLTFGLPQTLKEPLIKT